MPTEIEDSWAVTARRGELGAVDDALSKGGGILLTGNAGVGKTRLLAASLARLAAGGRTVVAVGGVGGPESGCAENFGSVSECLDHLESARRHSDPARRTVVGLDDAHLLHEASAHHLYRLSASGRVTVAATARRDTALPTGVDKLWVERLVERIEVQPLARDAIAAIVHRRVGGPVDSGTPERLWAATGGNALLLHELVEHSLSEGSLRRVGDHWRWDGLLAPPPRRLADIVRLGLGDLTGEEQELVSTLSVVGHVEYEVAERLGLARAAEALDERGVVQLETAGRRIGIRLALSLTAPVVTSRMSGLTAQRLRLQMASAIEATGARREEDVLRVVALRVAAGTVPPAPTLLAAARTAVHHQNCVLAERLCRLALEDPPHEEVGLAGPAVSVREAAWDLPWTPSREAPRAPEASWNPLAPRAKDRAPLPAPRTGDRAPEVSRSPGAGRVPAVGTAAPPTRSPASATLSRPGTWTARVPAPRGHGERGAPGRADGTRRAELLLGRALAGQNRYEEAEAVFAEAFRDGAAWQAPGVPRDELVEAVRARAGVLAWGAGRVAEATAVVEGVPEGVDALHGFSAVLALLADRPDRAAELGDRVLPGERADSEVVQALLPPAALAHSERGRPDTALRLMDRHVGDLGAWRPDARLQCLVVAARCAFAQGDLARVADLLDEIGHHATTTDDELRRLQIAVLRARLLRFFGRPAEAVHLLRRAGALRVPRDWLTTPAWILAQLAGALAESGRPTEALRTLVEAQTALRGTPGFPLADDAVVLEHAVVLAHAGDRAGASSRAWEVARRAGTRPATALTALHLAARVGNPARAAAHAARLAAAGGSGLMRLQADHVLALAGDDGAALDAVSAGFRAMGALPLAAEAAGQAAAAYRKGGRRRAGRLARAASARLLAEYGGPLPPWVTPEEHRTPSPAAPLTTREREVAALAAGGLSNRDIADSLVVSVRTVENHLYRVYEKLGITARSDLPHALPDPTLPALRGAAA
ncbi:LuxR C-terminal-related transcriptional regulator [Streptomyces sp. NPDC003327]